MIYKIAIEGPGVSESGFVDAEQNIAEKLVEWIISGYVLILKDENKDVVVPGQAVSIELFEQPDVSIDNLRNIVTLDVVGNEGVVTTLTIKRPSGILGTDYAD